MKSFAAWLAGFLAAFALALLFVWASLIALDQEADNRAIQQLKNDKKFVLKMPQIYKGRYVDDCQIYDGEVRCIYRNKNGELKMLSAN